MPPSTRSLRSLRSRRTASPTSAGEESEAKLDSSEPIVRPSGSTSGSDDQADPKKKSRSVTFSQDTMVPPSPSMSDASSSAMKKATSARAQRSLRRQAKIETDPVQKGCSTGNNFSIMKARRRLDKHDLKPSNSSMNSTTIMRKGPSGKEEEVVKVKLNTGTLYLYKGVNRRAVFVRRI